MPRHKISKTTKSPIDIRDKVFTASASGLPKSLSLKNWAGGIEDQGSTGSCTGNSTVSCLEIMLQRVGITADLSRLFAYYNLRTEEQRLRDNGGFLREAFKSINKVGICLESVWPFDISKVNVKPSEEAYRLAAALKCTRYETIRTGTDSTISNIKAAIGHGFPVVIGMNVNSAFYSVSGPLEQQNYLGCKYDQTDAVGGHAMAIIGYDDNHQYFIVENSWSSSWGDGGFFALKYDVALRVIFDAYLCTGLTGVVNQSLYTPQKASTRVFVGSGDFFTAANSGLTVIGSGNSTVRILPGVINTTLDANFNSVELPEPSVDYYYVVTPGVGFQIQNMLGDTILTIPSCNQEIRMKMYNAYANLVQTGGTSFEIAGVSVPVNVLSPMAFPLTYTT